MSITPLSLFKTRRFCPLFIAQFLEAFNDNVFKNALVILITYQVASLSSAHIEYLVAAAAGLFILPFFLFSALAGQCADKYDKSRMVRVVKLFGIVFSGVASYGFFTHDVTLLLCTLFLMGTHSAFFGPIKYAILPQHLKREELITGNALVESGTFVAILLGTLLGGLLIATGAGPLWVSLLMLLAATGDFGVSCFIPRAPSNQPDLQININIVKSTYTVVKETMQSKTVFLAIIGISWFWLIGATFLTQFPTYVKSDIGGSHYMVTLFLAIFSLGIMFGSLLCERLLKGDISARYVPIGILGMSVFAFDLCAGSAHFSPLVSGQLITIREFLSSFDGLRISLDLLLFAVSGGLYIVPLYTMMQAYAKEDHRSRVIGTNNIMNAIFMVISAIFIALMLFMHASMTDIFFMMGVFNIIVGIYIFKKLPHLISQSYLRGLLTLLYRVEVKGLEHYKAAGSQVVIIANHTSFLDAVLLSAFLEHKLTFVVNTAFANKWWLKLLLSNFEYFQLDPTNPMATKSLIRNITPKTHCVIFPEGRLTVTGAIMKIYDGPGLVAYKSNSPVLPIRIDGAQYTPFSRMRGKLVTRWFPKITLTILPAKRFEVPDDVRGRARRKQLSLQLYDMMTDMLLASSRIDQSLYHSLLSARKLHKGGTKILEDATYTPMSYQQLVMKSLVLRQYLYTVTTRGERVGLLVPNMNATVVVFFAMQSAGRVPAMLNYSTGVKNLVSAAKTAELKTVFTARKFVEMAKLGNVMEAYEKIGINIIYLEDLNDGLTRWPKLLGWFQSQFCFWLRYREAASMQPNDPAVVLFTSGSEGEPKGVVLSHRNVQANRYQMAAKIDINSSDLLFNALPIFHSFGLTVGTLFPLFSGIKIFLYPTPLHYRIIPELVYDKNATIFFGTNTFLSGYGKYANPYDFYSVRYVFAGAEKVQPETSQLWMEKFGLRILEGYGATETAPALSINSSMHCKPGTVGRFMPGIDYRLDPVPGIHAGGRLYVKGPNVMLGYMKSDKPGKLQAIHDGWYDTGDICDVDDEGYITILGRAKRFAKVGGEMVSLTAVESMAREYWPSCLHAVIAKPDEKKGERLILITEEADADRSALARFAKEQGYSELFIPREIQIVKQLPVLGSGKIDYAAIG